LKIAKPNAVYNKEAWEKAKSEVRLIMLSLDFETRIEERISAANPVARVYASHIVKFLTEAI